MATPSAKLPSGGILRRLVRAELIDEEKAISVNEAAQKEKVSVVRHLTEKKIVEPRDIATTSMHEFGIPILDLSTVDPESLATSAVESKLIEKHHALPLQKRGNRLFIALSDPSNLGALDEFKFATGLVTEPVLVEEDKLAKAIEQILNQAEMGDMTEDLDEDLENLDVSSDDEDESGEDVSRADADDTPVVRYVNKLLVDAINKGASDIHVEPYACSVQGRWRSAGSCQTSAGNVASLDRTHESHVTNGYLRATSPPGRTHQDEAVAQSRHRFSRQYLPHPVWRKGRPAYTRPEQRADGD